MNPTRRGFLKAGTGAVVASVLGFDVKTAYAQAQELKIAQTTETRSTCPYCAVELRRHHSHAGRQSQERHPQVVHVEGDPDHPINRGTLCPKGSSLMQDILNERRRAEAASSPARVRSLGRHRMGPGFERDGAPHQEDARRNVHRPPTRKAAP